MYIGSHNLYDSTALHLRESNAADSSRYPRDSTPAAWGRLENAAGGPQLKLANWELGVLLPSACNFARIRLAAEISADECSRGPLVRASSAEELEKKASDLVTYRRPLVPVGSLLPGCIQTADDELAVRTG